MKRKLLVAASIVALLAGCQKDNSGTTPTTVGNNSNTTQSPNSGRNVTAASEWPTAEQYTATENEGAEKTTTDGSAFISLTEANEMIASYLYSIHFEHNDHDIHSLSVDADMLRAYLSDPNVKNVKLILGHTMGYIHAGHRGHHAGYTAGALTIIIAGYDDKGNYVYHDGMVLDHLTPCPTSCPSGEAGSNFLY